MLALSRVLEESPSQTQRWSQEGLFKSDLAQAEQRGKYGEGSFLTYCMMTMISLPVWKGRDRGWAGVGGGMRDGKG